MSPKNQNILFNSKIEQYAFLSNFYAAPFTSADGLRWPTTEHYYQAYKFVGKPLFTTIQHAETAKEAKDLGRSEQCRADWEKVKEQVMVDALRYKFTSSVELRRKLLDTWSSKLIERSNGDAYWGDGGNGFGLNRLGYLLMQLREQLKVEDAK